MDRGSITTAFSQLNAVKIEAMLFGTHPRLSDADFGITFKGRPIMRALEFKYLGVVFDEHIDISWNSHVKPMCYPELVNDWEC